jgi:hypothetical protein
MNLILHKKKENENPILENCKKHRFAKLIPES